MTQYIFNYIYIRIVYYIRVFLHGQVCVHFHVSQSECYLILLVVYMKIHEDNRYSKKKRRTSKRSPVIEFF